MLRIRFTNSQARWLGSVAALVSLAQACSESGSKDASSSGGSTQRAGGAGSGGLGGSSSEWTGTGGLRAGSGGQQLETRTSLVTVGSGGAGSGGMNPAGGSLGVGVGGQGGLNTGGLAVSSGGAATGGTRAAISGGAKNTSGGSNASGGTGTRQTTATTGGTSAVPSSTSPTGSCSALSLKQNVKVSNGNTDRFTWYDASCRPRSAAMQRVGGGYVRQFTYEYDGKTRTASGTGVNGYNGWGFPASHELANALAVDADGTFGAKFLGAHHAFYEYHLVWPSTNDVELTLTWFFATGRSNPVLAITYDLSAASPTKYEADTRTPYGDMAWDGDENSQSTVVSGVGWGDRYKFITKTAPLTMNSEWDYTEPNLVPYVFEWAVASDAEMGAVQTQTFEQHDAGGYWFYANWGKTSANQTRDADQVGRMPVTWNWTYQLNQYELCIEDPSCVNATTNSHRLAWGANYGAVGSPNYPAYGDDKSLSGHPYQSYSVFMVLGKHSEQAVFQQVAEIETVQNTRLTASVGAIATRGIGGVGRSDQVTLSPPGYDHRFSIWSAEAANNALTFKVVVSSGALSNPVLAIGKYTAASEPQVTQDGKPLTPGVDFFVSLDAANQTAYVTFHNGWTGTQNFEIR